MQPSCPRLSLTTTILPLKKSKITETEECETGEEQSHEHAHLFFDIKEIVHKQFVLASQTVNFASYCDVLRRLRENARRLLPELWRQKNCLLHHDKALPHNSFFFFK
jgi:hypothetical protein